MLIKIKNQDIDQFFLYAKRHLKLAGCWPVHKSKWSKLYNFYANYFIYPFSTTITLTIAIDLFFSLDSIERATNAIYVLASNCSFILKFFFFLKKHQEFVDLLKSMDNPLFITYTPQHEKLVEKWRTFSLSYSKMFFNSVYICVLFFAVFPFIDKENNNTLPLGGWVPFDIIESTRNYIYAYIFQMIGVMITVASNISIDLLPSIFMNIGCAQTEILKDNFKNAIENAEERVRMRKYDKISQYVKISKPIKSDYIYESLTEEVEFELHKILKQCVQHQEAITTLFQNIEKVFNPGMLFVFIFDGIAICVTFLQLLMVSPKSFKYISIIQYLIAVTVQITLYCWNGHHVIVQTSTIGDSCYEMEWFRCSTKMKKEIRIIMERCKRPVKLNAGGIFVLSVTSLTAVFRTSYQYFNVLRTVYRK